MCSPRDAYPEFDLPCLLPAPRPDLAKSHITDNVGSKHCSPASTPMPIETLIEQWFAVGWLIFGLSHVLYPAKWAALFLPLRERETGGLLLALFNFPLGLVVVLGHNVWVWGIPVTVTLAGWVMVVKSVVYLLFPHALPRIMPTANRMESAFRIAGAVAVLLGALLIYDSVFHKD
jgi:uncharacterized protein YjeT (DUF2065 family)